MSKFFLSLLNMSLTGSYVIIFVIIIRFLLKKAPKAYSYALWIVVAFRLLVPFSFESVYSLMPRNTSSLPIANEIIYQQVPQINSGIATADSLISPTLTEASVGASVDPLQIYIEIGTYLWILGVIALLIYSFLSIVKLKKQLEGAQFINNNIYEVKNLETPFVLGLLKPTIYLPSGLSKEEKDFIILHEEIHIERKDHIIKMIAFLILSLHWFNPLVWIAFRLMSADMEFSCDEKVLSQLDKASKKTYANSLLSLASHRHILNGNPLAFGEGNVRGRIKNVLNYKKPSFWIVLLSISLVIGLAFTLIANPKEISSKLPDGNDHDEIVYKSQYDKVEIEFLSDMMGFKASDKFETNESKIVAFIDLNLREIGVESREEDLENNYTNQYRIELSNNLEGYSCHLYYDSLYNMAYLEKDGGLYEIGTDFARYIDSLLENSNIEANIDDQEALDLFQDYGWTLDYKISSESDILDNINFLSDFYPNSYYYAYNNELSKDIGLDMSDYSHSNIEVDIYRIHESLPQEFFPMQDGRGIIIKNDGNIIGAYISAGRHSSFNACSLKGRSFEQVTGGDIYQWFGQMIKADRVEERLAKLEAQDIIREYIEALDNKDLKAATYCISKMNLLDSLSANILNEELYAKAINLPLTDLDIGAKSHFENLSSAKLVKVNFLEELMNNTQVYGVTIDLNYKKELTIASGEQYWNVHMVYESPQTGWKIAGFGH